MRAIVFKFCIHIESGQVYCGTENGLENCFNIPLMAMAGGMRALLLTVVVKLR